MADTQLIKDKLDVVQLIGEYLPLKKAGVYYKACCPFHKEKSPSFMIHPEKQFWHCFGCGKGGDIFSFVQEMEGLDFPEALKLLADRAGVKLENVRSEINKSQKNRIMELNERAASFWHQLMLELPVGKPALEYLTRRKLSLDTIKEWKVGYAPEQWDLLTKYFLKKGVSIDDLLAGGLTIKKEGSQSNGFDRFRGRIMFPISDPHGNVVGFTGRQLVENKEAGGKYMNSPQTPVYDKSRVLYGIHLAKTAIKEKDLAVLVEGQMDVITCHQAGMKNVVAASGTALTPEQTQLIKRYTNNVAVAFDADSAGINAAKRGIGVALAAGLNVKVIILPEDAGKDADECINKNVAVWYKAVAEAVEVMDWFFRVVTAGKVLSNPKDKQVVADELLPLIGVIPYAVERDFWLKRLADMLGTDISTLKEDLVRLSRRPAEVVKTIAPATVIAAPVMPVEKDKVEKLIELVVLWLARYPALFGSTVPQLFEPAFLSSCFALLYELWKKQYNESASGTPDIVAWSQVVGEVEWATITLRAEWEFEDASLDKAKLLLKDLAVQIKEEWTKKRRHELQQQIVWAEQAKDMEQLTKLVKEFQNLNV